MRGSGSDASVQDDYLPLQVLQGVGSLYRTALTRRLGESSCSLDVPEYYAYPSPCRPRVPRRKLPRSDPVMSCPADITGPKPGPGQRHHPARCRVLRRAIGHCPPARHAPPVVLPRAPMAGLAYPPPNPCRPARPARLGPVPTGTQNSADSPGPLEHRTRGVPGDFARLQTGPPARSGRARLICRGPRPSPSAATQIRGAAVYFRVFDLEDYADGYRPTCYQSGSVPADTGPTLGPATLPIPY